ncbi:hypothetical protein ARMSODRAFT_980584 [Armillaria solidipes]|uniref:Uncharacterized protein n=1 Tax=Armillaria solidipes TaxID=1076256 RepID=A0A2H3AUW6_9AGAR|nr:hypothetical protein ARMSODRAFT_980584 [Armillaria solidipes]
MTKCIILLLLIFHHGGFWETGAIWMALSGYNEESFIGQELVAECFHGNMIFKENQIFPLCWISYPPQKEPQTIFDAMSKAIASAPAKSDHFWAHPLTRSISTTYGERADMNTETKSMTSNIATPHSKDRFLIAKAGTYSETKKHIHRPSKENESCQNGDLMLSTSPFLFFSPRLILNATSDCRRWHWRKA